MMSENNSESPDAEHSANLQPEVLVGRKLRLIRMNQGLSLRALAMRSGLNVNTLSLIENGKTSPSVGTLHQLALALEIPLSAFFESTPVIKRIVFTPVDQRPQVTFGTTLMQNLGKDLAGNKVQPFVVTLEPDMGSGDRSIVHTGHEFVFCLRGSICYRVDQQKFILNAGDSLLFEAHLPHSWENKSKESAQILLILYPSDEREDTGGQHLSMDTLKKELTMKIAVITDDGKTISQHFGRAPYYLVLTIEEGKVIHQELRNKPGHNQYHAQHRAGEGHSDEHGMDSGSHQKHIGMAEVIADCKVLLCGGMGMGAYDSLRRLNVQPIITDLREIEVAVQTFIDGKLVDHTELLH